MKSKRDSSMGMKLRFSDFLDSKGLALPAVVMVGTVVMGTITFMMSNSISEKMPRCHQKM